ncbi:FAD-dependent oxidoreductase [Slackia heliotrinireducens]|uniref:FAD-dependent oxidoreductase n=1 Tax=Slackia heliotrinireducens TaxID=84110 RepID=UPI0033162A4E
MGKAKLTRRDFIKGAGLTGVAAAGTLALAPALTSGQAVADEVAQDRMSMYVEALGGDATMLPMLPAECPGPRGPIAFEDREIADSEITSTEETDVLVVGAGIGGLIGTLKAADLGANVVALEKMTEGRASWESFGAVGARFQVEQKLDIDPAQLKDEILRAADWRVDPQTIESYISHSGEVADFWQDQMDKVNSGIEMYKFDQAPNYNGFPVIDSYVNFKLPEGTSKTWLFGLYVCEALRDAVATYDTAEIRYSTPAVQLIREDGGRVTGAIAKTADGSYIRINASKGVLLATGGYDANPEMMQAWIRPEDYQYSSWWNPSWGTTGDGHMMGLKVGADMDSLPHAVMNFSNATPGTFVEKRVYFPGPMNYGIIVNEEGKRFVNENNPRQYVSNCVNVQMRRGHTCYSIWNQEIFGDKFEQVPTAEDQVALDEAKGFLFRADTLDELAEKAGIDAEGLKDTVARYNKAFEDGLEREEEFYRYTGNNVPISDQGPFYALLSTSVVLATVSGLTIDGNANVLDRAGKPIEGLYATGNASGNFYSGNYPRHIPGTSVGRAATFGYVAAMHMLEGGN